MLTRDEAVRRLGDIEREIQDIRTALQDEWGESASSDDTQHFLDKCGGWEDDRPVDALIAEIYQARTVSDRAADLFRGAIE